MSSGSHTILPQTSWTRCTHYSIRFQIHKRRHQVLLDITLEHKSKEKEATMKYTLIDQTHDPRTPTSSSKEQKYNVQPLSDHDNKSTDFAIMKHKLLTRFFFQKHRHWNFFCLFLERTNEGAKIYTAHAATTQWPRKQNCRTSTNFTSKIHRFFGQIQHCT